MLAHAAQSLDDGLRLHRIAVGVEHDVVHGHDALEQAVIVDDRQAVHLVLAHTVERHRDIVGRRDAHHTTGRHLADTDAGGRPVLGRHRHADIAVGDEPGHMAHLVDDGQNAAVAIPHQLGRLGQAGFEVTRRRVRGHEFNDLHRLTLR